MSAKILIVDDEQPARSKVIRFLNRHVPEATYVEASSGLQALEALEEQVFDAILLDIQMPEMSGFEVIDTVGAEHMPPIIFATAFDEYAIDAFEANAIDYLLKPFNFERFVKAFERVTTKGEEQGGSGLRSMLQELKDSASYPSRIAVKHAGKIQLISPDDILCIKSDEHYVNIETAKGSFCERKTMKQILALLDPNQFKRIHRSTIINIERIEEFEPLTHGDYCVKLTDGSKHTLSRRYTDTLGISL